MRLCLQGIVQGVAHDVKQGPGECETYFMETKHEMDVEQRKAGVH